MVIRHSPPGPYVRSPALEAAIAKRIGQCWRKEWYESQSEARYHARRSSEIQGYPLYTYQCPHGCGGYHISRQQGPERSEDEEHP